MSFQERKSDVNPAPVFKEPLSCENGKSVRLHSGSCPSNRNVLFYISMNFMKGGIFGLDPPPPDGVNPAAAAFAAPTS